VRAFQQTEIIAMLKESLDKNPDPGGKPDNGPKYILVIEGEEFDWNQDTITTEQIASLGGWDASQVVIEVDEDNVERTLAPGEIIEIKPGRGFGKKHRWKRG
jgi:Multiubiquitin